MAESFGLTGYESHEELAGNAELLARIDKEAASRAAFQQGELGLDRYGLRDKLPDFGIEYVSYEKWVAQ